MTEFPFNFAGGGLPDDLAGKIPLFAELQKLLSSAGPVNWELARQMAVASAAGDEQPAIAGAEDQTAQAVRLADLWLDPCTSLASGVVQAETWTRVQWIEQTLPTWGRLCDPVAASVATAMRGAMPAEVTEQAGPLLGALGSIGGLMFGMQVGQALARLAGEVLSSTDVGLPLGPAGRATLLPANVAEFGEGLGVGADEVRLYVALREAAHHRLYGHVPWLRAHVLSAVETYARGVQVDSEAMGRAMAELDPGDPESLQQALGGGLFEVEVTPDQQVALTRLETTLALVEGWVGAVVDEAATDRLPGAPALAETLRRRRATGGPAEQTFATLVGLELRPRRLREATALWVALRESRGVEGRDAVWQHPDLLPGAEDLADPTAYLANAELLPPDESSAPPAGE